jgi:hypothetical protein
VKKIEVLYKNQILTLTQFWGNNAWCLWIKEPSQISLPKMQFVGGYPNEWCIFVEDLTEEEKRQITTVDGIPLADLIKLK